MNYHPLVKRIKDFLIAEKCWFETFEHQPVRTSDEAAKIRSGYTLAQGAKAMILRAKNNEQDKRFIMLVLPGDLRFDNDKVKTVLKVKDIRFATAEEINQLTGGVEIGGIPPFGGFFNLETVVDPQLFKNEKIVFNAGDRRYSIAMRSDDFIRINSPRIFEIT